MEKWFKGFHHFYLGIFLLIAGFVLMGLYGWYWTGGFIALCGVGAVVDDLMQHFKQRKNPEYHSPLHRLYGKIYSKFAFIRWLNKIADKILGK